MPPVLPATKAEVAINMVTDDDGKPYYQRHLDRHWAAFKDAQLADFTLAEARSFWNGADTDRGLFIVGPTGTGKTHMLVAVFREHCKAHPELDIAIVNWLDMVDAIKAEFSKDDAERREPFYFKNLGVLLIDDFGKGRRTGWEVEQMYQILNARWTNRKLTYFSSNYPLSEVEGWGQDGEAIASRIRGMCNVLVLVGEDRRVGQ